VCFTTDAAFTAVWAFYLSKEDEGRVNSISQKYQKKV
jgi:hypothetical protein